VYNVIGVIVDAVYPYKKTKDVCSLRIIDQTINSFAAREEMSTFGTQYVQVQFFSNKDKEMPIVTRVGDILRLYKVQTATWNSTKQFNCNLFGQS